MPNIALELGKQSASFGVTSAYGDPVVVDGVTIVPVAATWHGFGAGSADEGGEGAGGGGCSLPLGAYVRSADTVRFEPNLVALLVAAVPFVWFAGRALARVIRALKK